MTARYDSTFSRRDAPELCWNFGPRKQRAWGCRVPDAPAAPCATKSTGVEATGPPDSPGIPARNGFNGFLRALPGDRALLSPSSTDHSANLTPASGRQDHTTSPSASASFARALSCTDTVASTASRTNVRDDREAPLKWDGTRGILVLIWGRDQQGRLRQIGTTGKSSAC